MRIALLLIVAATLSGCALTDTAAMQRLADDIRKSADRVEEVGRDVAKSTNASADLVTAVSETAKQVREASENADDTADALHILITEAKKASQVGQGVGSTIGSTVAGPGGAAVGAALGDTIGYFAALLAGGIALHERKKRGQAEVKASVKTGGGE